MYHFLDGVSFLNPFGRCCFLFWCYPCFPSKALPVLAIGIGGLVPWSGVFRVYNAQIEPSAEISLAASVKSAVFGGGIMLLIDLFLYSSARGGIRKWWDSQTNFSRKWGYIWLTTILYTPYLQMFDFWENFPRKKNCHKILGRWSEGPIGFQIDLLISRSLLLTCSREKGISNMFLF